jgi:hypothetical protein
MSRGLLIGLVIVLAGVAGVFVALYVAGRREERQRVLRQLNRQSERAQRAEQEEPAPVVLTPVTEVVVQLPPPQAQTA